MSFFEKLKKDVKSWWASQQPRKLSESMIITWDDTLVRVQVAEGLNPSWNQEFAWADITRVCFKAEGARGSDIVFVELRDKEKPAILYTEAQFGMEFLRLLVKRELFTKELYQKAMTALGEALYCWPPRDD